MQTFFTAIILFLINYLPGVGMYIIIPAAMVAKVHYGLVIVLAIVGNIAPALTVVLLYEKMLQHPRTKKLMMRFSSKQMRKWAARWGWWFIFLVSPWTGTWVTGVTAKLMHMDSRRLLQVSLVSITLFAFAQVGLIALGFAFMPDPPEWLVSLL